MGEREAYACAVKEGYVGDFLANLIRRYFKRFPYNLPHDQEPTMEFLACVDDDAADPGESDLEEEGNAPDAQKKCHEITYRKEASLKSSVGWLISIGKIKTFPPRRIDKPRKKAPMNIYSKAHYDSDIRATYKVRAISVRKEDRAALRAKTTKEFYDKLSKEAKEEYKKQATEEHAKAIEEWKTKLAAPPLQSPEDLQRCIQSLPNFVEPIIDLISTATGLQVSFIAGGPEPADGGRLNIIGAHSRVKQGPNILSFGSTERQAYKNTLVPMYASFLKKIYNETSLTNLDSVDVAPHIDVTGMHRMPYSPGSSSPRDVNQMPFNDSIMPAQEDECRFSTLPLSSHAMAVDQDLQSPLGSPLMNVSHPLSSPVILTPLRSPLASNIDTDTSVPNTIRSPTPPCLPLVFSIDANASVPIPKKRKNVEEESRPLDIANANSDSHPAPKKTRVEEIQTTSISSSTIASSQGRSTRSSGITTPDTTVTFPPPEALVPVSLELPDDAPKWVKSSLELLTSEDISGEWRSLVTLWLHLELSADDSLVGRLSTEHRPACIGRWISRARSAKWRPEITDLESYTQSFWSWWKSLQPEWRIQEELQ
ncbi:hypothetical protein BJ138DRAFT_1118904 [Hygrophoropsis aurantiaca]|uniref:Uncharacterized protein n=1 Tax=Hygrophoropsis aurantiaca TaxID=72124 RepID=A0ACB7ZUZ3_9AGAM|nr:hypothetical protein BJ138DRAFT_1118904 [Hygrophoropsis aurantiaca]